MSTLKLIAGIILCIVGIYLVFLEVGMLVSEPHCFWTGGWIPFTVIVVIGVLIFVGGILLCKG